MSCPNKVDVLRYFSTQHGFSSHPNEAQLYSAAEVIKCNPEWTQVQRPEHSFYRGRDYKEVILAEGAVRWRG